MRFVSQALVFGLFTMLANAQLAPFNENGLTYGHVHLNVTDLEVHKKLYVEQFGGVVVEKGPLTVVKMPNLLIALAKKAPDAPSEGSTMDHFGLKVRDLQMQLAKWRKAGWQVTQEFTGAEGFPNAYLVGPDNVKIELQEDKTIAVPAMGYHIHFSTPEFAKLLDWYVDTFSIPKRTRGTIQTTAQAPGMNLSFGCTVKDSKPCPTGADAAGLKMAPTKGRTIDHIGFEFKNLKAFCARLEARGIKFDVPYREIPAIGLNIAYITDPLGTYIELTEGYDKY